MLASTTQLRFFSVACGRTNSMDSFVRHVCWDLGSITYNLVQDIYHTDLHFLICKAAAVSLMLRTLTQIICR